MPDAEELRRFMLEKPRSPAQTFWISQGEHHVKPNAGLEGFDVGEALREAMGSFGRVLEIGCGDGQTAAHFKAAGYVGVDINPVVVAKAKERLPDHDFRACDVGFLLPPADAVLFYDVLMHVPDDELRNCLAHAAHGRRKIVIAEMMDRKWRRDGEMPVFNRDPAEYVEVMRALAFMETRRIIRVCAYYATPEWAEYGSPDFTLMTFKRGQSNAA